MPIRHLVGGAAPLLLLAGLAAPAPAQAGPGTASMHGTVLEAGTGLPLRDAEVLVGPRRAVTLANGGWRLTGLPPGRTLVLVRHIGHAGRELVLELRGGRDTVLALELQPLAIPLDELVVTAARRPQRLADVTVPTEVVTRETIEATGAADLASVLTEQLGIQFQAGHPSGAGLMLQGLGSERVLVLLNGQPLAGRVAGTLDVSRIPADMVERVEVVKGPQSALYGSEAMGGVVNVITRAPVHRGWAADARAVAGGDGRLDAGLGGSAAFGDASLRLDLGRRGVERAPGQATTTGAVAERLDASARLHWRPAPSWDVQANILLLDERQRWASTGLYDFADNEQVTGSASLTRQLDAHQVTLGGHLSRFDHLARQSQLEQPIEGTGTRQVQELAEVEALWSGPALGATMNGGLELRREFIHSSDGRIEGGDRSLATAEPFLQAEWATERWSLAPGGRITWSEQWGSAFTPRLAARFRAGQDLTLRATAGRGFRAPDFKELYLQFTNEAAGYAVYGNPDLRPEHSTSVAVGVEWTGVRAFGRVQGFWNDLTDFIETRPVAGGGGLVAYEYANVSHGRTWGTELEGGIVLPRLRVEASWAWLATRDEATGEPLLGRPTHSARLGGTWAPGATRLNATLLYTGATPMERDDGGQITSERDAFLRLDTRLTTRLPWELELSLGADNLFDARPDAWADAIGRQWYAGIAWRTPSLLAN